MLGLVRLLLALQAIAVVGPLTENGDLRAKTPSIQPQGFQKLAAQDTPELLNNVVYEVSFVEGGEALRGTGAHPLYSLDRDDWVRVRDLQVGERLQTAEGAVTVEALEKVRGVHRVYNLEVEGDHEYLVGEAGVRAHNSSALNCGGAGQKLLGQPISWQPKDLQRVLSKHGPSLSGRGGPLKSRFFEGEDIGALIKRGTHQIRVRQAGGKNFERVFDVGRNIGVDVTTGKPTSIMTVVTQPSGRLVTAFPGSP